MTLRNDDYPHYISGSWTPVLRGSSTAGTPTYTRQAGSFEKIGRLVVLRFYVSISAIGGMAGNLQITGLPFTPTTVTHEEGPVSVAFTLGITFSTGYTQLTAVIDPSTTFIALYQIGSGLTSLALPISGVAATMQLIGLAVFRVDGN